MQRLCDLIIDKELRISQGSYGRATVTENFNLEKSSAILLSVIKGEKVVKETFSTINRNIILEEFNLQN